MRFSLFPLLLAVFISTSAQENGKAEVYQSPFSKRISMIAVSPDGKTVIASDTTGYVFFWERGGGIRKILRAHTLAATGISFSPDGKYFATTSFDGQIIIWNFISGEKIGSLNLESRAIALSFNTAGDMLFYANRNGVFKVSLQVFKNPEKIFDASLTCADADGNSFFVAGNENSLNLFRLTDGKLITQTAICDNLKKVELRGNSICALCENGDIQSFEIKGTDIKKTVSSKFQAGERAEILIPGDSKIMVASKTGVVLWDTKPNKFFTVTGLPENTTAWGYAETGNYYAGTSAGKVILCQVMTGAEIPEAVQGQPKQEAVTKAEPETGIKVEMTAGGIPKSINGRPVQAQQPVEVSSPSLDVYVWDDEHEDGDTVSLNFNGAWVLQDYRITAEKKKLTVTLVLGKPNYLMLYALNLGKFPPNTAVVSFNDGKSERLLTLESDLKHCDAVSFTLKQ